MLLKLQKKKPDGLWK